MVDVSFETMREIHIAAVLEIEHEAFSTPWTEQMFLQEVEESGFSRCYVALEKGRVVGYFVAWFLRRDVHLLNLAVAKSHQRKGIGRLTLQFLLDLAKREYKNVIALEVRESNEAAIRLYRTFGFTPVGVRHGYYDDDNENALVMSRSVSGWDERT
jgi:ribosomal-protein-alanine N-acetyltransferase